MEEDELRASLAELARIHKTPKALLKAVLERHPKAKKKDVAHEAYRLMIEAADSEEAPALQDVAISLRSSTD